MALLAVGALAGYLALRTSGNDHAAPDLEATLAAELARRTTLPDSAWRQLAADSARPLRPGTLEAPGLN